MRKPVTVTGGVFHLISETTFKEGALSVVFEI